jgi:solute:Na+ symporter, SSS family
VGREESIDPLLYQYGVGGIVFVVGLVFAMRQGYVGLQGNGLRNGLVLLIGFAGFLILQATLQYAPMGEAKSVAYNGPGLGEGRIGTGIDYAIMVGYFLAMLLIGTFFGRNQSSTKDFFFGGQRFAWWLIAFSLVATTIGSYSFVKYSRIAYKYGIASSQTYLNDWFWAPLLLFGWLPILYFSRVVSIPEYFERRFSPICRRVATVLLLVYLIGYVGINLFTMGKALNILLGWPVFFAAFGVAAVSAVYVTFGGQTSVIMTDLFQGVMLLATGLILLWLGMEYLGGPGEFWNHLPRGHRTAFTNFNTDPSYHSVGIFWQDAMANSAMFYFLNQGMVMRLMAARSIKDSRRAVVAMLVILMPIAAIVVASGGWVGKALVHAGALPELEPGRAFFVAANLLAQPGVFGLVMAALTAALMSTVDSLITAISAIVVNDVYKPMHPKASERKLLSVARVTAISISIVGVALVPVFMSFGSIYSAHGAFTAAVTPPLVVSLLFGVFWRRFTPVAALWTMVAGSAAIFLSILFPEIITPFAHGVPMKEVEEGFLAGKDQYKFMRGFFGIVVCSGIGVVVTLFSKARPLDDVKGLVWGTVRDAIRVYKGSDGREEESDWVLGVGAKGQEDRMQEAGQLPVVAISEALAKAVDAKERDLLYISDPRKWLGGLRSSHVIIGEVRPAIEGALAGDLAVELGPALYASLARKGASGEEGLPARLRIKRLY